MRHGHVLKTDTAVEAGVQIHSTAELVLRHLAPKKEWYIIPSHNGVKMKQREYIVRQKMKVIINLVIILKGNHVKW